MASRGVERSHTEKQALKQHTRKAERQSTQGEGRRRDFVNEIEFNNAATGGHAEDPIPTRPNSRSAVADQRRAAEKGTGVMSVSKKVDPDVKVSGVRPEGGLIEPMPTGDAPAVRRTKSNAEIADVPTTAKRSPAPRTLQADRAGAVAPRAMDKRTGGVRQRVPAPGNVVSVPKGELVSGIPESKRSGVRSTASSGGAKPPKRPAKAGKGGGAARSKGADMGLGE
ncbi:MAG TPA: hypothetical protein VF601_11625 [Beijerinckiaceae bacterium]|jgi:hypothetical protein